MEPSGREGRIQITEATRDLVHENFVCEPGGQIDVEGKVQMSVGSRRPPQRVTTGTAAPG